MRDVHGVHYRKFDAIYLKIRIFIECVENTLKKRCLGLKGSLTHLNTYYVYALFKQ